MRLRASSLQTRLSMFEWPPLMRALMSSSSARMRASVSRRRAASGGGLRGKKATRLSGALRAAASRAGVGRASGAHSVSCGKISSSRRSRRVFMDADFLRTGRAAVEPCQCCLSARQAPRRQHIARRCARPRAHRPRARAWRKRGAARRPAGAAAGCKARAEAGQVPWRTRLRMPAVSRAASAPRLNLASRSCRSMATSRSRCCASASSFTHSVSAADGPVHDDSHADAMPAGSPPHSRGTRETASGGGSGVGFTLRSPALHNAFAPARVGARWRRATA